MFPIKRKVLVVLEAAAGQRDRRVPFLVDGSVSKVAAVGYLREIPQGAGSGSFTLKLYAANKCILVFAVAASAVAALAQVLGGSSGSGASRPG